MRSSRSSRLSHYLLQQLSDGASSALKGKPLAIACSGGVDSVVLAHALIQASRSRPDLLPQLALFHVDHAQHDKSAQIRQGVQAWGESLGVPVFGIRLELGRGCSEEAMRRYRYGAFERLWNQWQPVGTPVQLVLAHHAQDQLETMVFRLLRGTHPLTLRGMACLSTRGNLRLYRPLLDLEKAELIEYAHKHNLPWQEDPTNRDTRFSRNALRHELFPLLEKIRPRSSEKLLIFFKDLKELQAVASAEMVKIQTEKQMEKPPIDQSVSLQKVTPHQVKAWVEGLLGDAHQRVKRVHWSNLMKALELGLINGERRVLEFPGGLRVEVHRRQLRFFPGKT